MKVMFLDSIETATYGGMEEWIRLVGTGLAARGHDVTVSGRAGSQFLRRVSSYGRNVHAFELSISGDFQPATINRIKKYLDEHQIDIIVVNFNKDVRLGGIAARWNGATKVVWSVGLDITKDNFTHRLLTPRLVDAILVPSQSLKTQITRHGYIDAETVTVIPIGIEATDHRHSDAAARTLRTRYGLSDNAIVAVTAARLVEQKGHRYMIDALPAILSKCPNFYWLLLGSGPLESELRSQAETLGVSDQVVFAGMLDAVAETIAGADLMVHPSIDEPFGIALVEGMRAGLPIVASRVGGIPEVVGDCAILVKPSDSEDIARGVCAMLDAKTTMTERGVAGRKRFETEFTCDRMIDRVEQYLTDVVRAVARG